MEISRRDFIHIAAISGLGAATAANAETRTPSQISLKDIYAFKAKGNFSLLHMCDLHAHIKPLYWREPSTLISAPKIVGTPGFLCGEAFAKHLKSALNEVNEIQEKSEVAVADMATGQVKDLHQAALAIGKAETSMKLMLEIRNKALNAYKELGRTQL